MNKQELIRALDEISADYVSTHFELISIASSLMQAEANQKKIQYAAESAVYFDQTLKNDGQRSVRIYELIKAHPDDNPERMLMLRKNKMLLESKLETLRFQQRSLFAISDLVKLT